MPLPLEFTSERLILRVPSRETGAMVNEAIQASYAELAPWMPWVHPMPTVAESEANGEKAHLNYLEGVDFPLRLFLKDGGLCVGSTGIHPRRWDVPSFEIGYWIRTNFTGQGYATEAVLAAVAIAREHLRPRRLEIRMDDNNERSWRVAERCGFVLEGILRCECRGLTGGLRNTRIYAKTWPDEL